MKKRIQANENTQSRRNFLKSAGMGAAAVAGMPLIASGCNTPEVSNENSYAAYFNESDVVLLQGDSITDAGRKKEDGLPNEGRYFGWGYANIIASKLLGSMPEKKLTIYNRGISGNKVYQLDERWQEDCLDLKPNILSILIGVNDYWHYRLERYDGTAETYENDFRKLLERTRTALPDIKLIICQPFVLPGTRAVDESWVEPFSEYQAIAKKISGEFNATWVPFQSAFNAALELAPAPYWAEDGVHPSMAGAQLMADEWLKAIG